MVVALMMNLHGRGRWVRKCVVSFLGRSAWDSVWRNQPIKSTLGENYAPRDGVTSQSPKARHDTTSSHEDLKT